MRFHRYYVPDAFVFITQVVSDRAPAFADPRLVDLLRATLHEVQKLHPFAMLAYVFLPEHLHLLIRPEGSTTHSDVMHSLKPNFTKAYKERIGCAGSMKFWQKRYWDHVIRDEQDFAQHLDYIHYNPVKHGLTKRPEDWQDSSFAHWKLRGVYEDRWGWDEPEALGDASWEGME